MVERVPTLRQATQRAYQSWSSMRSRCRNPKDVNWPNYGGRGIAVCERWGDFAGFLADMGGDRPVGFTIERVDNDRGYEPGNCIWATTLVQARNRRTTKLVEWNGETVVLAELCDLFGIGYDVVHNRLDMLGWSLEDAVSIPVQDDSKPVMDRRLREAPVDALEPRTCGNGGYRVGTLGGWEPY